MVVANQNAFKTDVLVAGGGPAGLAAAIAARQKGFKVTVADAATAPIDKACGEGLMPWGVSALDHLGIHSTEGFPFAGIRFLGSGVSVEAQFRNGPGMGVRRTTLHRVLAARAAEAGVVTLWGARVEAEPGCPITLAGRPVIYDWLVGADGLRSSVRRWASLEGGRRGSQRFGFRRHFRLKPWSDFVEVYWGERCQLFVTPVGEEEVGVALLARDPHLRLEDVLQSFPEVTSRIENAQTTSAERGGATANRALRAVTRNRVALVGDASGSVDAITGDGLSLALKQAVALAGAMENGDLNSYQAAHQEIMRTPAIASSLLLELGSHARLRKRVFNRFASNPALFQDLFNIHTGPAGASFGLRHAGRLGWRLLAPQPFAIVRSNFSSSQASAQFHPPRAKRRQENP